MSKATLSSEASKADQDPHRLRLKELAKKLEVPIFPRSDGRWAKKIKGRFAYFGKWTGAEDGDWQTAMALYESRQEGDGDADPKEKRTTVSDSFNAFLNAARGRVESGELPRRTFYDNQATAKRAAKFIGRKRVVETIRPAEWSSFRGNLAKGRKLLALKKEIVQTRMICKWGMESGLLDHIPRFGPEFKPPKKDKLQIERNKSREKHGSPVFESAEVRTILAAAKPAMKAMVLLGLNAAYGQSDISRLPLSAVDLEGGWVSFARRKTGVGRKAKLWPETVDALREAIAERPKPKLPENVSLVFVT